MQLGLRIEVGLRQNSHILLAAQDSVGPLLRGLAAPQRPRDLAVRWVAVLAGAPALAFAVNAVAGKVFGNVPHLGDPDAAAPGQCARGVQPDIGTTAPMLGAPLQCFLGLSLHSLRDGEAALVAAARRDDDICTRDLLRAPQRSLGQLVRLGRDQRVVGLVPAQRVDPNERLRVERVQGLGVHDDGQTVVRTVAEQREISTVPKQFTHYFSQISVNT